jgi:hypothetical protein
MISRIFSDKQRSAFLAVCVLLAAPVAVAAQDAGAELLAPSTLVLTTADGAETQYQVTDVALYLSSNPAYDDVPASTSLSVTLTTITPVDAALLQWAAQTTGDTKELRNVKVTTSVTNPDGKKSDLVYDVTDAHVTTLSATNSLTAVPSISLTLEAAALLINGAAMN